MDVPQDKPRLFWSIILTRNPDSRILIRHRSINDFSRGSTCSPSDLSTPENVMIALRQIDAPDIFSEDFARIYKGAMAEILNTVARNVVGRNGAAVARNAIHQCAPCLASASGK